jgi:hypothetical protein
MGAWVLILFIASGDVIFKQSVAFAGAAASLPGPIQHVYRPAAFASPSTSCGSFSSARRAPSVMEWGLLIRSRLLPARSSN